MNKTEIAIAMCGWVVAVIVFSSTIYNLFFVKWAKLQGRTKKNITRFKPKTDKTLPIICTPHFIISLYTI